MISIITINLNNCLGLTKTIESVIIQSNQDFEFIVVDGFSVDGSSDVLKRYSSFLTKCISEKDNGVYNAMNKAILLAENQYFLFLNSGDTLISSTTIDQFLNCKKDSDLLYGDIIDLGNNKPNVIEFPKELTFEYMICGGLPHQATAIKRTLFQTVGLYIEKYKIISDWVFFMEALFIHNATYSHIHQVISNFEGGGLSSSSKYTKLIVFEQVDYIKERFPKSLLFYYENSPYVKKYFRQKSRIFRWFFKLMLFKFNRIF